MKLILILFFLSISLSGCSFIESILPKEKFYCKINGERFRPEKDDSPVGGIGTNPLTVTWNKQSKNLSIYVRGNGKLIGLKLLMPNSDIEVGKYILTNDKLLNVGMFSPNNNTPYPTDLFSTTGEANITKVAGYNLSGTFFFTCKDSNKEYKITKGEFNDISYY